MSNSEVFKKSIGSDEYGGPRVYVTYSAYGYSDEITKKLRAETEKYWEAVKSIIKSSAGSFPPAE
jgi:hypothetical protein